jgi:hypothetical protein
MTSFSGIEVNLGMLSFSHLLLALFFFFTLDFSGMVHFFNYCPKKIHLFIYFCAFGLSLDEFLVCLG